MPADNPYAPHVIPGLKYGLQSVLAWAPGETDARLMVDLMPCQYLWRAVVLGSNVVCKVVAGSSGTRTSDGLLLPLVVLVAGQLVIEVRPIDNTGARASVAVSVASGGLANAKRLVSLGQPLGADVHAVTALAASTLTVAGTAGVVIALGQRIEVAAPSALTAGGPLLAEVTI